MKKLLEYFQHSGLFVLYILGFLFAFRIALPSYVNSSFISGLLGEQVIGLVYAFCALVGLIAFLFSTHLFRRFGVYRLISILVLVDMVSLLGMAFLPNPYLAVLSFALSYGASLLIGLCMDIFVEHHSNNLETGRIRSIYLTSLNFAWLSAPLLATTLIDGVSFVHVYILATILLIPMLLVIRSNLKGFTDPVYSDFGLIRTIQEIWQKKDVQHIISSYFLLQCFYVAMVIYTPIYLHNYIGFTWTEIGQILLIMLLPFVLIQIPLGMLADKKLGEKEILNIGFLIIAVATMSIPFIQGAQFWVWAGILFITRIGAAAVEVMSDTYFYKNIGEQNVNIISFYKSMIPFSSLAIAVASSIFLLFFPIQYIFFFVGFLMLFALRFGLAIHDTK